MKMDPARAKTIFHWAKTNEVMFSAPITRGAGIRATKYVTLIDNQVQGVFDIVKIEIVLGMVVAAIVLLFLLAGFPPPASVNLCPGWARSEARGAITNLAIYFLAAGKQKPAGRAPPDLRQGRALADLVVLDTDAAASRISSA
jgi:hypothetical protein